MSGAVRLLLALAAAVAAIALVILAAASPPSRTPAGEPPMPPPPGPELDRCRSLGEAALEDPACRDAWRESRRRFLQGGR